jgi:hypothetical protein
VVGGPLHVDARVVLQVLPDLGHVGDDGDPVPAQLVGRAGTGQHEQLRRAEGAGAQDDLPPRADPGDARPVGNLDPDRRSVVDHDACGVGLVEDVQVRPADRGTDVSPAGAPAQTAVDRRLGDVHALLAVAVVVARHPPTGLLAALQQRVIQPVLRLRPAHLHRSDASPPLVGSVAKRLHPLEVGQAVGVVPLHQSVDSPAVVVERVAAIEDHRVDRRRPAHDPARLLVDFPAVQLRFGPGPVAPLHPLALVDEGQGRRHDQHRGPIRASSLDEQHRDGGVLAEPARYDAARRPRPDHDVVIRLHRVLLSAT